MQNVNNVSAGKPKIGGAVFVAPIGTELPEDVTTQLNAAFKGLGYCSDDGITNTNSPETEEQKAWGGDTVLNMQASKADTFKLKLLEVLNVDVLKTVYGENNVTGTIEAGITIKANNSETEQVSWVFDIAVYYSQNKVKLYCPRPIWTKENPYTFHSYGVSSSDNKRYPGRYPHRYANGMNNTYIQNHHFTDANFTLVIYGPVVNPQVIIGDKSYLVNIVLEQGERLEIDSRTRTVTKISKNGEQVNAFHNREKGKKFFKKIPPGRQKVVWSGKFDWDLVIYEERSEPRWSGWKQR